MNSKRSYLDNVNTGRQRRSGTSIDQISDTLDQIESRLERAFEKTDTRQPADDDITRRMQRLSAQAGGSRASLEGLARDFERTRRQQDEHASLGGIAAELKTLREDVRQLMSAGLKREFETLRDEIAGVMHAAPAHGADNERLGEEFERLSGAIARLAERSDDRSVKMLRLELEEVKKSLATLAREESLHTIDRRWDDFDHRWSAFEDRVSSSLDRDSDPAVAALNARLEQIGEAVDALPESLSLRSLEERVRTLAGTLARFVDQHDRNRPDLYGMIEERLDEISRAITASTASLKAPAFDPAPFERIEARVASLARQVGELIEERPGNEVVERLNALAERVDVIAERIDRPEHAVERLAGQISTIAEKLETAPQAGDADRLFQGLEARLDDISGRLESSSAHIAGIDPDVIGNLQAQVASLSEHMTQRRPDIPEFEDVGPRLDKIERSIAENRETVMEAARQAAEHAIGALGAVRQDPEGEAGLRSELKTFETLARKADERNTRTFEAIHDTLLKIVDRLSTLEGGAETGHLAPASEVPQAVEHREPRHAASRHTPAEAAAAAAEAALRDDDPVEEDEDARRSMLGGLSRALAARQERHADSAARPDPALAERADEKDDRSGGAAGEAALDAALINEPLEPGSGAPDLNAIMRRVRDEHERPVQDSEVEIAKSDFIAAARRAAQAAAADAEVNKSGGADIDDDTGRRGIGRFFRPKRKTALLALGTAIVVVGGLQFGNVLLSGGIGPARVADTPADDEVQQAQAPQEAADTHEAADTREADDTPVRVVDDRARERDTVQDTVETAALPQPAEVSSAPRQPGTAVDVSAAPHPMPAAKEEQAAPAQADAMPAEVPAAAAPVPEVPAEIGPDALREAAADGDPKAMFEIASRYADGRGVETDMAKAAEWYEHAAEIGLAPAQYRFGNFAEKGTGVERDLDKARKWYQLAAEQGNASAMHNLGVLYAMGADGVADNESAARWFLDAAERGVVDSQFNLGILSAKGVGVPKDLEESYKWFALVAKTGDEDAAAKRDEIAAAMTPEQLERAKGKAELWKEKEIDRAANVVDIPVDWTEDETTTASVDMEKVVTNIQLILNKNGFDAGPADGVMGERTKAAIMAFQKDNGMEPTGRIDEALVNSLLKHN